MSLLADLLSKIRHTQSKREIPPNLKHIVSTSAQQSARRRKIILISGFVVVAVIAGIFAVYFINSLTGTLNKDQGSGVRGQKSEVRNQKLEVKNKFEEQEDIKEVRDSESKTSKEEIETKSLEKKAEIDKAPLEHRIQNTERKPRPEEQQNLRAAIDAYLYSARNHEIKKDYSKALSDYRKILEIDKNNFPVMNNIAYMLLQLGLINESIEYSQMALNIKKDYVPALINLAVAYAKTGDISAAETYLNRALIIEPVNQSVILNLAILYERKEDYLRAFEYFLKLSRLGDVAGLLGLARTYEKQDKKEEALKIYKNIYSLNSLDKETRQLVRQRIISLSKNGEATTGE